MTPRECRELSDVLDTIETLLLKIDPSNDDVVLRIQSLRYRLAWHVRRCQEELVVARFPDQMTAHTTRKERKSA